MPAMHQIVDMLFDKVEWTAIPNANVQESDNDIPVATHRGVLKIGNHSLRVYRLNNGQSIINAEDLVNFMEDGLGIT